MSAQPILRGLHRLRSKWLRSLCLALGGLALSSPALAQFNCPRETDPELGSGRSCKVANERESIDVFTPNETDETGGALVLRSWTVDGVEQLERQQLLLYDPTTAAFSPLDLTAASRDDGRDQIIIVLEDGPGGVGANVTFQLRSDEEYSNLNTAISIFGGQSARTQTLFLYTNYSLRGTPNDDLIEVDDFRPGSYIGYSDGPTSVRRGVITPPFAAVTSFDVGEASEFEDLLIPSLIPLDGTQIANGPADLVSVQAWDLEVSRDQGFYTEITQSVLLPEPSAGGLAAGVTLTVLARRRRLQASPGRRSAAH